MPHLNNTASCHFRVSMHQYNYSKIFVSIRGSPSPTGRAHARHPRTTFSSLLPSPYEKIFVSIRVHSWFISFRHFVPFVLFVVQMFLVSIRVHSWFISFRPFVVHILSIPSCPFVASKDHSAIKKQTGHPRKIIKKVYISTCYSRTSFPYGTSWSP